MNRYISSFDPVSSDSSSFCHTVSLTPEEIVERYGDGLPEGMKKKIKEMQNIMYPMREDECFKNDDEQNN